MTSNPEVHEQITGNPEVHEQIVEGSFVQNVSNPEVHESRRREVSHFFDMSTLMKKRALMPVYRSGFSRATASRPLKRRRTALRKGFYRRAGYYGRYPPLGSELKFFDTNKASTPTAAAGTIFDDSLCHVPAGTGESERIGRKITIKSISVHTESVLISTSSSSNCDDAVRMILYHDKQCNGATAAVTDILESAAYRSFNNLANKNRFRILKDMFLDISCQAGAGNGTTNQFATVGKTRNFYLKCNIPVEFSSTTGAISEIRSNNIGVLVISSNGLMEFGYTARIRYTDS